MQRLTKIELLLYISGLLVLVLMEAYYETSLESMLFLFLPWTGIFAASFVVVYFEKWSAVGFSAAFMMYSGLFACTSTFINVVVWDPLYDILWCAAYAFCGVFGGIRTYRAWLKHRPVKERKL
jgi:hypothetical protein